MALSKTDVSTALADSGTRSRSWKLTTKHAIHLISVCHLSPVGHLQLLEISVCPVCGDLVCIFLHEFMQHFKLACKIISNTLVNFGYQNSQSVHVHLLLKPCSKLFNTKVLTITLSLEIMNFSRSQMLRRIRAIL